MIIIIPFLFLVYLFQKKCIYSKNFKWAPVYFFFILFVIFLMVLGWRFQFEPYASDSRNRLISYQQNILLQRNHLSNVCACGWASCSQNFKSFVAMHATGVISQKLSWMFCLEFKIKFKDKTLHGIYLQSIKRCLASTTSTCGPKYP